MNPMQAPNTGVGRRLCPEGRDRERQHHVVFDTAGFHPHARLTCMQPECKGATLVWQPWMNDKVWNEKVAEFKNDHPQNKKQAVVELRQAIHMYKMAYDNFTAKGDSLAAAMALRMAHGSDTRLMRDQIGEN